MSTFLDLWNLWNLWKKTELKKKTKNVSSSQNNGQQRLLFTWRRCGSAKKVIVLTWFCTSQQHTVHTVINREQLLHSNYKLDHYWHSENVRHIEIRSVNSKQSQLRYRATLLVAGVVYSSLQFIMIVSRFIFQSEADSSRMVFIFPVWLRRIGRSFNGNRDSKRSGKISKLCRDD